MSENITLTNGGTGTIYGTFANAKAYLSAMFGDQYATWLDLADDDARKQTLIAAARFLDRQSWVDDVNTFTLRDTLASLAFQLASYELGAFVADDPSVLAVTDQGTNIQAVNAGGAGVTFFNPTSQRQGSAPKLPPILMDLVGVYLANNAIGGPDGGSGQSGSACNPFDSINTHDRTRPW